jgi:hypothetical protein
MSIYLIPRLYQWAEEGVDSDNGSHRIMNGIALKYDLHDAYIPGQVPSRPAPLPASYLKM